MIDLISASMLMEPKRLVPPNPWVGHIPFVSWLMNQMRPNVFVELGTHTGNSYCAVCQAIDEFDLSTRAYAIDTWRGDEHAGQYDDSVYQDLVAYHDPRYGRFSTLLRMTFDEALAHIPDGSVDLLHIDGLHTYEAVKHDFETWLPKLSRKAVVLFHDTCVFREDFGVYRLWGELAKRYPGFNFLHSNGLGVLLVGEEQLPALASMAESPSGNPHWDLMRNLFARLGGEFELRLHKDEVEDRNRTLLAAIAERDSAVLALHEAIADRDSQLHRLFASSSWRVTRPLRYIRRQLANRPTHRVWNLIRNSVAMARSQIRQHGLVGFVRRLPYYLRNVKSRLRLITQGTMSVDAGLFSNVAPTLSEVRLHPDLTERGPMVEAFVSVVIPTLNAGHEFSWLLKKLLAQKNVRRTEVVIVDSGSSDDTVAIARAAGCTVVEIAPADFSHSYARNKGADAASGDHLLFMVQDAYPIGDFWLYGMLRYLQDHGADRLVAVSCAEYCRSDSDMMYDSMAHTHYRFLGCLEYDRIGEFRGDDHMALRSQGQLSDVSCLISREVFARYRYRGDYAEDLDLGIRIIKDGLRVAMLASVKVIHSHNRPAYYYLKRSFVDVIFLVGLFPDFSYPKVESQRGILAGIASVAGYLSDWKANGGILSCHHKTVAGALGALTEEWRRGFVQVRVDVESNTGDVRLDAYVNSLKTRFLGGPDVSLTHAERQESRRFLDAFLARLDHFKAFIAEVYELQDGFLARELDDAVMKTFAAAAGSALAFMYLDFSKSGLGDRDMNNTLYGELKAGI